MRNGKTRVLLVYPKFPSSFWSFEAAIKILGLGATMPPLGLATIAAMLPEDLFEVRRIVDMRFRELTDTDIIWAEVVMISAMDAQSEAVKILIARLKKFGKIVIVGGPYPTTHPDEVLAMGADHLILGEAELTLPPFLEDWRSECLEKIYSEASVRDRTKVRLNKEFKPELDLTPIPLWKFLEMDLYQTMPIQYSRGCPFDCEFCAVIDQNGHIPRVKTPSQITSELDALWAAGWKRGSVFIVDDNFIGSRKKLLELLPELIDWQKRHGFPYSFFTEASINLANDDMKEILDLMVAAGFEEVFIGLESNNPEVLARMGKRQNKGDLSEKIAKIQRAGLSVTAGFIIGADGDKLEAFPAMFQFIQDNGVVIAMLGLLTAIKGTKLYDRLKAEGRLRGESSGLNTHQFKLNFDPLVDETKLIQGYIDLLDRLYSSKNYYARCRTLQKRLGKGVKKGTQTNWRYARAMVRVFYHNLVSEPDWEFVKFIVSTVFTHPNKFPEAISEAAKLRHFQEITRETVTSYNYDKFFAPK